MVRMTWREKLDALTDADRERFFAKVDDSAGGEGCWPWMGCVDASGYGAFSIWRRGRTHHLKAHRLSMYFAGVDVGAEDMALHACHNRRCVAPHHLRPGTAAENARDAVLANRVARGRTHRRPKAKLSEDQAREIYRAARSGMETQGQIASRFGIHGSQVSRILNGRIWPWVSAEPEVE